MNLFLAKTCNDWNVPVRHVKHLMLYIVAYVPNKKDGTYIIIPSVILCWAPLFTFHNNIHINNEYWILSLSTHHRYRTTYRYHTIYSLIMSYMRINIFFLFIYVICCNRNRVFFYIIIYLFLMRLRNRVIYFYINWWTGA